MIKTEFSYSQEEVHDFFSFHLTTKTPARLLYYFVAFLFLLSGVLATIILKENLLGLFLIVVSVLIVLYYPFQLKKTLKKLVEQKYKRDKQTIIFEDDKIETIIESKAYTYKWQDILEVNETTNYLYLYVSKTGALIVKKSLLSSKELLDLIAMIKKHKGKIILYPHK